MPPQWQGSEDTLVPGELDEEGAPERGWVVGDSEEDDEEM